MSYFISAGVCLLFSYLLALLLQSLFPIVRLKCKKVALVIAHPDDEVMFFSPAIHHLIRLVSIDNFFIVCVTKGGHDGAPGVREKELIKSCTSLGIHKKKIMFLDNDSFKDHPKNRWDVSELSSVLDSLLLSYDVDTLLTFDSSGVSGHPNHCDTHMASMLVTRCQRLILSDTIIFRKYSSAFGALFTYIFDGLIVQRPVFISDPTTVYATYSAMKCHASQFVWFRKLYFLFSRYILVNHLNVIPAA